MTVLLLLFFVYGPNLHSQDIQTAKPESGGYSSAFLRQMDRSLEDSIPSLGAFIIYRHNKIIHETYFHGADSNTQFNIKSITKSVVSALGGIAKGRGLLPDLKTPVVKLLPELAKPRAASETVWFYDEKLWQDSMRSRLNLSHLLSMQHGWDWNDFEGPVGIFINAVDPVRFTMDIPFREEPGSRFLYSSAATSLFAAALEKRVQSSLKEFADKYLFTPANIHCLRWDTDPQGRNVGCSEMYLTGRDLLRFGRLYLHRGRVNDIPVIPEEWIKESVKQHAQLDYWDILPGANGYGYCWWRRKTNGREAWIASGAGGQIITIIPEMDMVVVMTCLLNEKNRGRSEIRRIHEFIDKLTTAK